METITRKKKRENEVVFNKNNHVELIHSGKPYFSLLKKMIDEAEESIHLQVYILDNDGTGTTIADALIAAAGRGIKVFVLVDGYASQSLPTGFVRKMQDGCVRFRFFEPLLSSRYLYFGRRLHHKVVVVDTKSFLVGGLNIADRYNDTEEEKAWYDLAIYGTGEIAESLETICRELFKKGIAKGEIWPAAGSNGTKKNFGVKEIRISRNDWVRAQQGIFKTYLQIFRSAKKDITIMTSYFLPGTTFRKELKRAVKRGVKVRVIMASLSDIKVTKYAERYLYRWMLRNKMEIYEFQPTILHAKMAMADDDLVTLGSFNVNNISAYASLELNLDVKDKDFCAVVEKELVRIQKEECLPINEKTYTTKLFSFKQFLQWGAFQLIRVTLTISTFYFRQKRE